MSVLQEAAHLPPSVLEGEANSNNSLQILKDTRRLLIDRLPVASELLHNASIVFPARRQYLLDWLLDAFYRLLRAATPEKIAEIVNSPVLWNLLNDLLSESPRVGLKRRKLMINRPILPLFSTYFNNNYDALTLQLVKVSMETILNDFHEASICKCSVKHLQELLSKNRELLVEVRIKFLLAWSDAQGNKLKVFSDLNSYIIPMLPFIKAKDVREQLLCKVMLSPEVIRDLNDKVKNGSFELFDELGQIGAALLVGSLVKHAKDELALADYRLLIVRSAEHLIRKSSESVDLIELVKLLRLSEIASIQNDEAWQLADSLLTSLINSNAYHPVLLENIANMEVSLLLPMLPEILSSIGNYGEKPCMKWRSFLDHLAKRRSEARQLDTLVMSMVENLKVSMPTLFIRESLRSLLQKLHGKTLDQMIVWLTSVLGNADSSVISKINAAQFLLIIIEISPVVTPKVSSTLHDLALSYQEVLQVKIGIYNILEVIEERAPGSIVDFHGIVQSSLFHAGCSLLSFVRGHRGQMPKEALADHDACVRYLPALLKKDVIPVIPNLPKVIFKSAIFWESLRSVDDFVCAYWNSMEIIESLISNLPDGIELKASTAASCLERVSVKLAGKILNATQTPPGTLDSALVKHLFSEGITSVKVQLHRRGLVDKDFVIEYLLSSTECLASMAELVEAILPDLSDEQVTLLLDVALQTASSENSYGLLAILSRRISGLFDRLCAELSLNSKQRWNLAAAFKSDGDPEQVKVEFSDALQAYFEDATLTARDVMLFLTKTFALSPSERASLLDERQDFVKRLQLIDILLVQSLDVQNVICPVLDEWLLLNGLPDDLINERTSLTISKLLHHRLICGGANIGRLQDDQLFDQLLRIVSKLVARCAPVTELCSILSAMLKFHWQALSPRRPLFIVLLQSLLTRAGESSRKVARLLSDFASIRQTDQHYYISPLLLSFAHLPLLDATVSNALTPAMCMLLRHLDQQLSAIKSEGREEKYFDPNPLHRLMTQAVTDDAKVILKGLIKTYMEEYRFTGKA